MKQLQNNFTTLEQLKRLLEFRVPTDSAYCYWRKDKHGNLGYVSIIPSGGKLDKRDVPCWSVGRLIEIYEICVCERFKCRANQSTLQLIPIMEDIMEQYQMRIESIYRHMDFSKLEE